MTKREGDKICLQIPGGCKQQGKRHTKQPTTKATRNSPAWGREMQAGLGAGGSNRPALPSFLPSGFHCHAVAQELLDISGGYPTSLRTQSYSFILGPHRCLEILTRSGLHASLDPNPATTGARPRVCSLRTSFTWSQLPSTLSTSQNFLYKDAHCPKSCTQHFEPDLFLPIRFTFHSNDLWSVFNVQCRA